MDEYKICTSKPKPTPTPTPKPKCLSLNNNFYLDLIEMRIKLISSAYSTCCCFERNKLLSDDLLVSLCVEKIGYRVTRYCLDKGPIKTPFFR